MLLTHGHAKLDRPLYKSNRICDSLSVQVPSEIQNAQTQKSQYRLILISALERSGFAETEALFLEKAHMAWRLFKLFRLEKRKLFSFPLLPLPPHSLSLPVCLVSSFVVVNLQELIPPSASTCDNNHS
ncbi:hypothetical protein CEXT_187741 [Caerostris extrusa]|uniref:Uncharacterized protein n=1 Tax=Caerostris extrusa TaxID=172846 RepID=A0AAV4SW06_CAEEX|nr:hypothetical protein CEXT_187741 [Caerostris extrusa]